MRRLAASGSRSINSLRCRCTNVQYASRAAGSVLPRTRRRFGERSFQSAPFRRQEVVENEATIPVDVSEDLSGFQSEANDFVKSLPPCCPGCGAPSQTVDPEIPGFYNPSKRPFVNERRLAEDRVFKQTLDRLAESEHSIEALDTGQTEPKQTKMETKQPHEFCHRCHNILHQSRGEPILHPSVDTIRAMIEESDYTNNHIYHVIDSVDFPMSLVPNLATSLNLPSLRTKNRRSKSDRFIQGRSADVTFVISRSDLLAPQMDQAGRMLQYLKEVLREAMGRGGEKLRLNMRLVSAHRGWWTVPLKQEIFRKGGAGWMIGRLNVGKSALFQVVFPKGRSWEKDETPEATKFLPNATNTQANRPPYLLLPPAQIETPYPVMPIVSDLPGTTASAIRIPYGKGRGELIDLPGINRSLLDTHVKPEHRSGLLMTKRISPKQHTVKPGQSLLLGGMIRITPKSDEIYLAYPFITLHPHVTNTQKARAIQTGIDEDGNPYTSEIENIATGSAMQQMKSAGTFQLKWDVTRERAGPLTAKDAVKMKPKHLPFTVYGADILIESLGWVELVCQVRRRPYSPSGAATTEHNPFALDSFSADAFPEVEVFTPNGAFVAVRRPLNAWLLQPKQKNEKRGKEKRPRQTISMQRRREGGRSGPKVVQNLE